MKKFLPLLALLLILCRSAIADNNFMNVCPSGRLSARLLASGGIRWIAANGWELQDSTGHTVASNMSPAGWTVSIGDITYTTSYPGPFAVLGPGTACLKVRPPQDRPIDDSFTIRYRNGIGLLCMEYAGVFNVSTVPVGDGQFGSIVWDTGSGGEVNLKLLSPEPNGYTVGVKVRIQIELPPNGAAVGAAFGEDFATVIEGHATLPERINGQPYSAHVSAIYTNAAGQDYYVQGGTVYMPGDCAGGATSSGGSPGPGSTPIDGVVPPPGAWDPLNPNLPWGPVIPLNPDPGADPLGPVWFGPDNNGDGYADPYFGDTPPPGGPYGWDGKPLGPTNGGGNSGTTDGTTTGNTGGNVVTTNNSTNNAGGNVGGNVGGNTGTNTGTTTGTTTGNNTGTNDNPDPDATPTPDPDATPTPTPDPNATPTPDPNATPTPSPSPSPTPSDTPCSNDSGNYPSNPCGTPTPDPGGGTPTPSPSPSPSPTPAAQGVENPTPDADQCGLGSGFPELTFSAMPEFWKWPGELVGHWLKCAIWLIIPQDCVMDGLKANLDRVQDWGPLKLPGQIKTMLDDPATRCPPNGYRVYFVLPTAYANGCVDAAAAAQNAQQVSVGIARAAAQARNDARAAQARNGHGLYAQGSGSGGSLPALALPPVAQLVPSSIDLSGIAYPLQLFRGLLLLLIWPLNLWKMFQFATANIFKLQWSGWLLSSGGGGDEGFDASRAIEGSGGSSNSQMFPWERW